MVLIRFDDNNPTNFFFFRPNRPTDSFEIDERRVTVEWKLQLIPRSPIKVKNQTDSDAEVRAQISIRFIDT